MRNIFTYNLKILVTFLSLIYNSGFSASKIDSYPIVFPEATNRSNLEINKQDLLDDLKIFPYIMSQSYGSYPRIEKNKWDQGFESVRQKIQKITEDKILVTKFAEIFGNELAPYLDNHFSIKIKDSEGENKYFSIVEIINSYHVAEECREGLPSILKKEGAFIDIETMTKNTKTVYLMTERELNKYFPTDQKKCIQLISKESKIDKGIRFKDLGSWKYVKIGSFWSDEYFDKYKDLFKKFGSNDQIILDLRSNGGGDSNYISKKIVELGFKEKYPFRKISMYTTKVTTELFIDFCQKQIDRGIEVEKYKELKQKSEERLKYPFPEPIHNTWTNKIDSSDTIFTGKIVVIVGKGCASSCEAVVDMLDSSSKAIVIGTNTYGAYVGGDSMAYNLEKTKIKAFIPMQFYPILDKNLDFKESRGFFPDYWLEVDTINMENIVEIAEFVSKN